MNLKGLTAAVLLGISGAAQSYSVSFDLGDPVSAEGTYAHYADAYNYEVEGVSMSVTGWSSGGDSFSPLGSISAAQIGLWNNWMGVEGEGSMSPTMDNFGLDFDFLMFEFNQEVTLDGIGLGYIENDSDLSIATMEAGELLSVGSIYDADLGLNAVDAPAVASSIWIIGAFHPSFGSIQDFSWDGFKLNELSVDINPVPLPAAVWFLVTGLLGFGWLRRKAAKEDAKAAA